MGCIMISNQLLKKTLDEIRAITDKDMAVYTADGHLSAQTNRNFSVDAKDLASFADSVRDYREDEKFSLFKIRDDQKDEYFLAVQGSSSSSEMIGRMTRYQIERMLAEYKEKFDKDNFIKSLLSDNLLLVDIFERSRRLHVELEAHRVAFLIRLKDKNQDDAIGTLKNLFYGNEDFVTAIDKKQIVVVKQLNEKEEQSLDAIARSIFNALKRDLKEEVKVAYGTVIKEMKEVSKSYREAKMALDVGNIFFSDRQINPYDKLGIGRLIYQLPLPLCKLFISEIFHDISPLDLDEETLETINKFFENSLNVSETSRQLFIHRNTLVYRLDKIQKLTGLDLRVFDDAITFKIALMVSGYMKYVEDMSKK